MNLQTAYTYPLVKANPNKSVKIYRTSDIQSTGLIKLSNVITELNAGQTIGVITKVYEAPKGDHVAYVQLYSSAGNFIYIYSHGLVYLSDIEVVSMVSTANPSVISTLKTYYCTGNNVNIRKTPSTAGKTFGTQLDKGDVIGTSDGKVQNGYLGFNLRMGGFGYVSQKYVTLQAPAKSITVTKQITDPMTGKTETVSAPIITNPESSIDWKKTVIGAVVGVVISCGFSILIKTFSK
jgi:hypothetical protein